jgi:hypothetical protein
VGIVLMTVLPLPILVEEDREGETRSRAGVRLNPSLTADLTRRASAVHVRESCGARACIGDP